MSTKKKAKTTKAKPKRKRRRTRKANEHAQLTFDDARIPEGKHGGWRPGAGRPEGRTTVPHERREELRPRFPILVTWRLEAALPSLRQDRYASILLDGIAAAHSMMFRITDYSIQINHLHFIIEADGAVALAEGLQSLAARIVHHLNRAMRRSGKLFEERYHSRSLTTPREVKNALRYVLNNVRHHAAAQHYFFHPDWIDPFSSATWFDGWRRPIDIHSEPVRRVTAEPHTWLRRTGWRQWGLLDFDEIPGGALAT